MQDGDRIRLDEVKIKVDGDRVMQDGDRIRLDEGSG